MTNYPKEHTMTDPTFKLTIVFDASGPASASISTPMATPDEAAAFVATKPKAMKLGATTLSTHRPEEHGFPQAERHNDGRDALLGYVFGDVQLAANGVNGGVNETGVKRLRRWIADLDVEYTTPYSNSYPTLDEALAAIEEAS